MTSLLQTYNPSILAIPAYYIRTYFQCLRMRATLTLYTSVVSLLPHGYAVHVATQGNLSTWDNRNPRSSDLKSKLKQRLPAETFAKYERLEACHANGMEVCSVHVSIH